MAAQVSTRANGAFSALIDAENDMNEVCEVLTVLQMALACETGGLDTTQRSGIETVLGYANDLAMKTRNEVSSAGALVKALQN